MTDTNRAYSASDPNLSPQERELADETVALVKALAPTINLMLSILITGKGPGIGINGMQSALCHFIADISALAVVQYGADERQAREMMQAYADGMATSFEAQLAKRAKEFAETLDKEKMQ